MAIGSHICKFFEAFDFSGIKQQTLLYIIGSFFLNVGQLLRKYSAVNWRLKNTY